MLYTERDMEGKLLEVLASNEIDIGDVREVRTFGDAGILTRDKGLVVTMANDAEFQITIVQSRRGR